MRRARYEHRISASIPTPSYLGNSLLYRSILLRSIRRLINTLEIEEANRPIYQSHYRNDRNIHYFAEY